MVFVENSRMRGVLAVIAMVLLFWSPHIGLDYVYEAPNGERFLLANGQYIFFFLTLLSGIFLGLIKGNSNLTGFLRHKGLWAGLVLCLLGIMLASTSLWGWRLLGIVMAISLCAVIAANYAGQSDANKQAFALLVIIFPFCIPVFGSVVLEILGPIDLGVLVQNTKHMDYSPPRWRFLNMSANGFGFDAGLVSFGILFGMFFVKNTVLRILMGLLTCVAIYALIKSGTRASFVFFTAALLAFLIFYHGMVGVKAIALIIVSFATILFLIEGFEVLIKFLRIKGDLNQISSKRWHGIVGIRELIKDAPFAGRGFGAADNNFPVHPSNIFYFALLAEIGVFGFLGALVFMAYPLKYLAAKVASLRGVAVLQGTPPLVVFSWSVLAGFVPYLMFEFDVLRVSVNNQLFFFCWGVVMCFHANNKLENTARARSAS